MCIVFSKKKKKTDTEKSPNIGKLANELDRVRLTSFELDQVWFKMKNMLS